MEDSRWPKKIYQWTPHSRRRRGRLQQSWKNQVMDFMRSRNLEEDMTVDRYLMAFGSGWRLLAALIIIIITIIIVIIPSPRTLGKQIK